MINFTQTDVAANASAEAALCSALSENADEESALCAEGASAGSVEKTITSDASASELTALYFECTVAAGVSWGAGLWTVRFNLTTANHQITWDSVYICRVNSSYVNQATIGSATSLGQVLSSTGTKSTTVSGAGQSPSVGDIVIVVFAFSNGNSCPQDIGVTPSLNIDSPFTAPAADKLIWNRRTHRTQMARSRAVYGR